MPSPVAHSLAGFAVAHFALRRRAANPEVQGSPKTNSNLERISWFVALAFAANAADMDFLPGLLVGDPNMFHHGPTHSIVAAVVFGLLTAAFARAAGLGQWRRFSLLMSFSYFTHLLLDFVTHGNVEPYGMRLLWPFSSKPLMTPIHVFLDIRRYGGSSTFFPSLVQWHNIEAIAWEMAVMAGLWAIYKVISSLPLTLSGNPERKAP